MFNHSLQKAYIILCILISLDISKTMELFGKPKIIQFFDPLYLYQMEDAKLELDNYFSGNDLRYNITENGGDANTTKFPNFITLPNGIATLTKSLGFNWDTTLFSAVTYQNIEYFLSQKFLIVLTTDYMIHFYNISALSTKRIIEISITDDSYVFQMDVCSKILKFEAPRVAYFCNRDKSSRSIEYIHILEFKDPSRPVHLVYENNNPEIQLGNIFASYMNDYLLVFTHGTQINGSYDEITVYQIYLLDKYIMRKLSASKSFPTFNTLVNMVVIPINSYSDNEGIALLSTMGELNILTFNPQYQFFHLESSAMLSGEPKTTFNSMTVSSLCDGSMLIITVLNSDAIYEIQTQNLANPLIYSIYSLTPNIYNATVTLPKDYFTNLKMSYNSLIGSSREYILGIFINKLEECRLRVIRRYKDPYKYLEYEIPIPKLNICKTGNNIFLDRFNAYDNSMIFLTGEDLVYMKITSPFILVNNTNNYTFMPVGEYKYNITASSHILPLAAPQTIQLIIQVVNQFNLNTSIAVSPNMVNFMIYAKSGDNSPLIINHYYEGYAAVAKYIGSLGGDGQFQVHIYPKITQNSPLDYSPYGLYNQPFGLPWNITSGIFDYLMCKGRACQKFKGNIQTGEFTPIPSNFKFYDTSSVGIFSDVEYKVQAIYAENYGLFPIGIFQLSYKDISKYYTRIYKFTYSSSYIREQIGELYVGNKPDTNIKYKIYHNYYTNLVYISYFSVKDQEWTIISYKWGGINYSVLQEFSRHNVKGNNILQLIVQERYYFAEIFSSGVRLYAAEIDPGMNNPVVTIPNQNVIGGQITQYFLYLMIQDPGTNMIFIYDISQPTHFWLLKIHYFMNEFFCINPEDGLALQTNLDTKILSLFYKNIYNIKDNSTTKEYYLRSFDIAATLFNSHLFTIKIDCNEPIRMYTARILLGNDLFLIVQNSTHICPFSINFNLMAIIQAKTQIKGDRTLIFDLYESNDMMEPPVKMLVQIKLENSNLFVKTHIKNGFEFHEENLELNAIFDGFDIDYIVEGNKRGITVKDSKFHEAEIVSRIEQGLRRFVTSGGKLYIIGQLSLLIYDLADLHDYPKKKVIPEQIDLKRYDMHYAEYVQIINLPNFEYPQILIYGYLASSNLISQLSNGNFGLLILTKIKDQSYHKLGEELNFIILRSIMDVPNKQLILLESSATTPLCTDYHRVPVSNAIQFYNIEIETSFMDSIIIMGNYYTLDSNSILNPEYEQFVVSDITINPVAPYKLFIAINNYGILIYDYKHMEVDSWIPLSNRYSISDLIIVKLLSSGNYIFSVVDKSGIVRLDLTSLNGTITYDYWTLWDKGIQLTEIIDTDEEYIGILGVKYAQVSQATPYQFRLIILKIIDNVMTPLFTHSLSNLKCQSIYIKKYSSYLQVITSCDSKLTIQKYHFGKQLIVDDKAVDGEIKFEITAFNQINTITRTMVYKRPSYWFYIVFGVVLGCFLIGLLVWWIRRRKKAKTRNKLIKSKVQKILLDVEMERLKIGEDLSEENSSINKDKYTQFISLNQRERSKTKKMYAIRSPNIYSQAENYQKEINDSYKNQRRSSMMPIRHSSSLKFQSPPSNELSLKQNVFQAGKLDESGQKNIDLMNEKSSDRQQIEKEIPDINLYRLKTKIIELNKTKGILTGIYANAEPCKLTPSILKWQKTTKKIMFFMKFGLLNNLIKAQAQLFGKATQNCEIKDKRLSCLLYPEDKIKIFWSIIMILALLFTAIYIPIRVAFLDQVAFGMMVFEYIIDVCFALDLFINFFSAFYDDQHSLITDRKTIAKNYLTGWFLIDFMACFPFYLFDSEDSQSASFNRLLRIFRLGRLSRILRLLNIVRMFKVVKKSKTYEKIIIIIKMNAGIKRLINATITYLFLCHLFACMWFYSSKLSQFHPDTWVMRYGIKDSGVPTQYLISFAWVSTLTTIGYGDLVPFTNTERIVCVIYIILGVAFVSYCIGNLSSILLNSDTENQRYQKKILVLDELAASLNMKDELYYRIKRIIKGNHESHFALNLDYEAVLVELPMSARSQLVALIYKQNDLDKISFFQTKSPLFLNDILPCLTRITLSKDDFIYAAGDWADEMYFILEGSVKLMSNDNFVFRNYIQGSYFGDKELIRNEDFRDESAVASENCKILSLKMSELHRLAEKYPEIQRELVEVEQAREEKNKESLQLAREKNLKSAVLPLSADEKGIYNDKYFTSQEKGDKTLKYYMHTHTTNSIEEQYREEEKLMGNKIEKIENLDMKKIEVILLEEEEKQSKSSSSSDSFSTYSKQNANLQLTSEEGIAEPPLSPYKFCPPSANPLINVSKDYLGENSSVTPLILFEEKIPLPPINNAERVLTAPTPRGDRENVSLGFTKKINEQFTGINNCLLENEKMSQRLLIDNVKLWNHVKNMLLELKKDVKYIQNKEG